MTKLSLSGKERLLANLHQHNQIRAQRTVDLTRQAIARLKADGQKVTLIAVSAATRALDERGKGLAPNTILRNAEARELFHQESESYQARQRRAGKKRSRRSHFRSRVTANSSVDCRGLSASDLVQIIEQLKQTVLDLRTRQAKLEADRDAVRQWCDELQQQNIRQLAELTSLQRQTLI